MCIVTSAEARPVVKERPLRNDASGRGRKRASALTSVSCEDTEKMCILSADSRLLGSLRLVLREAEHVCELPAESFHRAQELLFLASWRKALSPRHHSHPPLYPWEQW